MSWVVDVLDMGKASELIMGLPGPGKEWDSPKTIPK